MQADCPSTSIMEHVMRSSFKGSLRHSSVYSRRIQRAGTDLYCRMHPSSRASHSTLPPPGSSQGRVPSGRARHWWAPSGRRMCRSRNGSTQARPPGKRRSEKRGWRSNASAKRPRAAKLLLYALPSREGQRERRKGRLRFPRLRQCSCGHYGRSSKLRSRPLPT